jgi:predicted nuclease of predicted toxin-antitoxin system
LKFKRDENFDARLIPLLAEGGHDADTVRAENLSGSADEIISQTCVSAGRTLITLDIDFANPFRFPPEMLNPFLRCFRRSQNMRSTVPSLPL